MHFHLEHYHYFEYGCLLVAVFCYKGLRRFSLLAFIPIVLLACVSETLTIDKLGLELYPIYNVYMVALTPFYLYAYRKMLLPTRNERVIFDAISVLSMLFLLLNIFFIQGIRNFNTFSAILTQVLNVIFSGLVLVRLVTVESSQTTLYGEPYFWICSATLLFNLISFVVLGLLKFTLQMDLTIHNVSLHQVFLPPASDVQYSVYSFAFILCQIRKTS